MATTVNATNSSSPSVQVGGGTGMFASVSQSKSAETKRAVKLVGGSALAYGLGGLVLGALVGGAFGYQRLRRRKNFEDLLTKNPCLDLSALYSDEAAVEAFAELMPYQTFDPTAWDTALFCGDKILRLERTLQENIRNDQAVVEDIPPQIGDQLVQLHRALSAIGKVVSEKYGYMEKQFDEAYRSVAKRFTDISYNASADVRDRKRR